MRIRHENMIIESNLPISRILNLEMVHQLNHHGTLTMKMVVQPEAHMIFLQTNYQGQNIQLLNHHEADPTLVFNGKIQTVRYEKQSGLFTASIDAVGYSIELDKERKRRSFQNTNLTFRSLLDLVIKGTNANLVWEVGNDRLINKPFIQYDETNWKFMKRLAGYFNRPVHASLHSRQSNFHFGIRQGRQRTVDEATILEVGVSEYYYQNGGYEKGESREHYRYIKVKHRSLWQIGDFVWHRNRRLTVTEQRAIFEKGELMFMNTLGAEGFLHQRTIYSDQLIGLNLQGTIRQVEKESIKIQLDIDTEEQAHYFWPWVPEVGNLNYLMPEIDSKVVLTLPTHDEQDGIATHLLRTNSNSSVYQTTQNKQIVTQGQKTIGLYPEEILLAGKDNSVTITLADQEGIRFDSNKSIRLNASRQIQLNGKKVTLNAPERMLMQTARTNVEMAQNFNFFAPEGVKTSSARPQQPPTRQQPTGGDNPNHCPLSYGALGAMPRANLGQMDQSSDIDFATRGAMPKMSKRQTAISMSEMMAGKKAEDTSHPRIFSSMDSHSMKGGTLVPREQGGDEDA